MIKVTVWNENVHERTDENIRKVYPEGIHGQIASFLRTNEDMLVRTATLEQPENGLPQELLDDTDVLIWWGHMAHEKVEDATVERVWKRVVMGGMGFVGLHSAHASKIFAKLMGTDTWNLCWHESGLPARVWTVNHAHPIAKGVGDGFTIPTEETYGERFGIPQPDELVFITGYPTGEVFRSGLCYRRGLGRVFYFQPGHESCPTYYQKEVQTVITNGVRWAAQTDIVTPRTGWTAPEYR